MSDWRNKTKPNKVQDVLGLKDIKKNKKELERNSIKMNEIDRDIYHDLVDSYEQMQDNLDAGLKEYVPFDRLSEDIFSSLYKYNAHLHDEEDMHSNSRFNHHIMDEIMQSDNYEKLRKSTRFDELGSAIGTEVLQDQAMKKIKYFKDQYAHKQQTGQDVDGADAGELINKINQAGQTQNDIDDIMNGVGGDTSKLSKAQIKKLAELQEALNKINGEIEQDINGQEQLQKGMNEALEKGSSIAHQQVEEVRDVVAAWGLEAGTGIRRISLDQRKKAIERIRNSERLKNLTDLIGRMKALATRTNKKKIPDGATIEDVELGNKIDRVIPSERMKLAHPATKRDFLHRYSQRQLMQYKKIDEKTMGRGPVVVCHDKSGSMMGGRDDWATALTLAMLEVAQKEKRNFAYIPYASHIISNMVKNINAGELDPDDIMDIAELSSGGGTNFMAPLDEALRCIQSDNYKKGDIVFITDGDCGVSDEWLKKFKAIKEQKEFYVNTVLINAGGYGGVSTGTIKKFSDNITTISDLANLGDNTEEIFRIVKDKDKYQQPDANANLTP